MTARRHASLGILVLVSGFVGCAAHDAAPNAQATRQAIQNGAPDETHRFSVAVCRGTGPGSCEAGAANTCSGVLLTPNLVATARHCVDATPSPVDCATSTFGARIPGALWITTGTNTAQAVNGWHPVKSVDVTGDTKVCGNDLALLTLNELVPATEVVPAAPGVDAPVNDPKFGRNLAISGFGATTGTALDFGERRLVTAVPITCITGIDTPCAAAAGELLTGPGACPVDDGAGAFEQASFDKGAPVALGILRAATLASDTCTAGTFTRFDVHRTFVIATAKKASNDFTLYPEPTWAGGAPTPADGGAPDSGVSTTPSDGGGTLLDAAAPSSGSDPNAAASDDGGCSVQSAPTESGRRSPFTTLAGIAVAFAVLARRMRRRV